MDQIIRLICYMSVRQVQIFVESDYVLLVVFLLLFVNCLIAFCFLIRYIIVVIYD